MSATWGEEWRPVVVNISVDMKARILAQVPRLLIEFDLSCGDFWFKLHPFGCVRFHVLQYPDLIHPRELAVVADAVGQRSENPT